MSFNCVRITVCLPSLQIPHVLLNSASFFIYTILAGKTLQCPPLPPLSLKGPSCIIIQRNPLVNCLSNIDFLGNSRKYLKMFYSYTVVINIVIIPIHMSCIYVVNAYSITISRTSIYPGTTICVNTDTAIH